MYDASLSRHLSDQTALSLLSSSTVSCCLLANDHAILWRVLSRADCTCLLFHDGSGTQSLFDQCAARQANLALNFQLSAAQMAAVSSIKYQRRQHDAVEGSYSEFFQPAGPWLTKAALWDDAETYGPDGISLASAR